MPINYSINADIVDIKNDSPKIEDKYIVDTNVWYWTAYTRATLGKKPPAKSSTLYYPSYIKKALQANSGLKCTSFSLAELAHLIECVEFEINSAKLKLHNTQRKEFRHNFPTERSNVVSEIKAAWNQVSKIAQSLEIITNDQTCKSMIQLLSSFPIDGYDSLIVEAMKLNNITCIITHDGDFASIKGITIFTCNELLIKQASSQNRLIIR